MKRTVVLIVSIAIILTAMPVFAAEPSLFQIMRDSISKAGIGSGQGPAKVEVFKQLKDHIADWDESSTRAKKLTLRGNEEELAKRRGTK